MRAILAWLWQRSLSKVRLEIRAKKTCILYQSVLFFRWRPHCFTHRVSKSFLTLEVNQLKTHHLDPTIRSLVLYFCSGELTWNTLPVGWRWSTGSSWQRAPSSSSTSARTQSGNCATGTSHRWRRAASTTLPTSFIRLKSRFVESWSYFATLLLARRLKQKSA